MIAWPTCHTLIKSHHLKPKLKGRWVFRIMDVVIDDGKSQTIKMGHVRWWHLENCHLDISTDQKTTTGQLEIWWDFVRRISITLLNRWHRGAQGSWGPQTTLGFGSHEDPRYSRISVSRFSKTSTYPGSTWPQSSQVLQDFKVVSLSKTSIHQCSEGLPSYQVIGDL